MANAITRAQIITLNRFTEKFAYMEEIKLAHRYASGNLTIYLPTITIDIFPNGNWRTRSVRTGEKITEGKFSHTWNPNKIPPQQTEMNR